MIMEIQAQPARDYSVPLGCNQTTRFSVPEAVLAPDSRLKQ